MISWSYLDKRDATIKALKDYDIMKFIIEDTNDEIWKIKEKAESIGAPKYAEHIRSGSAHSGEDRIIDVIEEIDTLKERYRQAQEYMAWFEPAWRQLSEDEQYILESYYLEEMSIFDLCEHFEIEKDACYKRKNRALLHLTTLLYGVL